MPSLLSVSSLSATTAVAIVFVLASIGVHVFVEAETYRASTSFSTYGSDVDKKHIYLDQLPSKTYTHYVQSDVAQKSYSFTLHVPGNGIGMFLNAWEIVDKDEAARKRKAKPEFDKSNGERKIDKGKICSRYSVNLSYPEDKNKTATYLCDLDSLDIWNFVDLQDYTGPGSVQVQVQRQPNLFTFLESVPSWRDGTPWTNTMGRSIPASSIGGLTFTLYYDCSNGTRPGRPCSTFHNTSCIANDLFCNGELNCVATIWDYLLYAHGKENSSIAELDDDPAFDPSFDESSVTCRGRGGSNTIWTRTTYTNGYGGGGGGGYGGSSSGDSSTGMVMVSGALSLLFGGMCWIIRKARSTDSSPATHSPSHPRQPRPLLPQGSV